MERMLSRKVNGQKTNNKLFFSFFFFIQVFFATAQAPRQHLYLNDEIKFERLGLEQGLNNYVNTLMQDRKGYMWFATLEDGLYKYDGYTLTHYQRNPRDTNSLADNSVSALYEDKNGIIWIGFGAGGGVNSFNLQTGQWKRYKHDPKNPASLTSGPIHSIQGDHQGRLWFGSLNGGLCRFDPKKGTFSTYKNNRGDKGSISNNRVPALFVDKAGQLWVGTNTGLDLYDPKTESFQHITGENGPITAPVDKNAKRNFSLQHISGGATDSILLTQTEVHYIIQDDKGLLWLSTLGKGIFVLDPVTKKFQAHLTHNPRLPNSLSDDYVVCITQDKTGNYWMQTGNGVNKLDAQTGRFSVYQQEQYVPRKPWDVHTAITDRGGVVWFGTMTKGALYFTPNERIFYRFLEETDFSFGLGANEVHSIFKGSDGQMYLTTTYSLLRFDPVKNKFSLVYRSKKEKEAQDPVAFFTACEERPGIFWIGTWGKGIIRYDVHTQKETLLQHNSQDSGSLAHNVVYALLRDRKGVVWAGTENGHLQRYDAAQKKFRYYPFRTHDQRTQFSEESFSFLFEDKAGNLWVSVKAGFVGTGGGGLYQINREKGAVLYYGQKGADVTA
jgi:ligand-binding sensor domain-containing protein